MGRGIIKNTYQVRDCHIRGQHDGRAPRFEGMQRLNLGDQGDLVSGLRMGITRVTTWDMAVINLPTKSP